MDTQPTPPGFIERRRDNVPGILRLDIGRTRAGSGNSVEFISPPDTLIGQAAQGQFSRPSPDRLSVKFVLDEAAGGGGCDDCEEDVFTPGSPRGQLAAPAMDKVRFSRQTTVTDGEGECEEEDGEEEEDGDDYSASACVILQRRASSRRGSRRRRSRRPSSPFPADLEAVQALGRRRSSVFTTSSGDTAITVEEGMTQEQIHENMRLHKEVLSNVKYQAWGMRKKMRLVHQAKAYIKRHEGELQERLAQSKTTRDLLEKFHIELVKRWQHSKRELANFVTVLIPWELRIKEIECHFGSVVASYFTFLRWMFWVNLVITVMLVAFVIIPEVLTANKESAGVRKIMLPEEEAKSTNLMTLWNFEGILKYSPIFYGYYTDRSDYNNGKGYHLPFAYFMTMLAVYTYSFVAILRRMAKNSRMSKLSEKGDECIFTWKLFTGWDYMIGNAETAHNRMASIILGFKEALLEEAERKRNSRNWKVISLRVLVNVTVMMLLVASAYLVVDVVNRSTEPQDTWWGQNETTIIMTFVSFVFPIIFELIGLLECYHPRKQLRVQLARIMVLNLLNLYSLIFAQFGNISKMTEQLEKLKTCTWTTTTPPPPPPAPTNSTATTSAASPGHAVAAAVYSTVAVSCGGSRRGVSAVAVAAKALAAMLIASATTAVPPTTAPASLSAAADPSGQARALAITAEYIDQYRGTSSDVFPVDEEHVTTSPLEPGSTPALGNSTDAGDMYSTEGSYEENLNETINTTDYVSPPQLGISFSEVSGTTLTGQTTDDTTQSESTTFASTDYNELTFSTFVSIPSSTADSETESGTPTEIMNVLSSPADEVNETCYVTVCEDETIDSKKPGPSRPSTKAHEETTTSVPSISPARGLGTQHLDIEVRRNLSRLCWETMFGQELVKLTVMDLVMTILSTLMMDFFRALLVRILNRLWCWDLEKQFPQYGDFKIAENILHLVNNQGMVWMGMFFSPGLPLINTVKLVIMMYLRSWATLTSNVPHEVVFRASRSNNFYLALLLTMLFLCVLPVGYAIVWVEPSWHCGPFSDYRRMYHLFTESLQKALPKSLHLPLAYLSSPGIVIPLLVLLVLIIYYLASLTAALREANNDLKMQLRRERTEERRKMFQLVGRRQRGAETPFSRWRRILPELPAKRPGDKDAATAASATAAAANGLVTASDASTTELIARLMKRALRESSAMSEDESVTAAATRAGDGDPEMQDLLPDDLPQLKGARRTRAAELRGKERQDSLTSCWSGDIPEIRISGAAESLLRERSSPGAPTAGEHQQHAAAEEERRQ